MFSPVRKNFTEGREGHEGKNWRGLPAAVIESFRPLRASVNGFPGNIGVQLPNSYFQDAE
jgi:hypothetical protein